MTVTCSAAYPQVDLATWRPDRERRPDGGSQIITSSSRVVDPATLTEEVVDHTWVATGSARATLPYN